MRVAKLLCMLALLFFASEALAQTGKIAGRVTDASTGDPLPGVNVVIEGSTQGATTDVEGYYTILNVRPGTYLVRATFIGYTPQPVQDVRVNIDLTTPLDIQLREEVVGLAEVVVNAERPVVQRDVSASVANLNAEEIENLPVTDVAEVIGLQAGFERGLTVRGSGGDQVQFQVDGMSMSSGMNNTPFTGISYTAVEEVQVQTGGFNAEYGNVRSGLINVVTKEGDRNRYSVDAVVRYAPGQPKAFGGLATDPDAYFMKPYFDPEVAFVGTENAPTWDQYDRNQFPIFQGWNTLAGAHALNAGIANPNDYVLKPAEMLEAYKWYRRKDMSIDIPDYEMDATIGGPIPLVAKHLGDLRFTASYRQTQTSYIVPEVRDSYDERTFQSKLTSDIAKGIKLNILGMYGKQYGINTNEQGYQTMFNGDVPDYPWDGREELLINSLDYDWLFSTHIRNPMDITHFMLGAQLTHTLSATTFYEVQLQRYNTDYFTFATGERDTTVLQTYAGGRLRLNEEPFGWAWPDTYDQLGTTMRTGGHWYSARDTSNITKWVANFDITSQVNRFMEVKTGLEYIFGDWKTNFGEIDPAHPHHANPKFVWNRQPQQGAAFGQTKLEFKGMVANIGLRMDYFHAGGEWYDLDTFDRFYSAQIGRDHLDSLAALQGKMKPTEHQFALSPRLGVSFPITESSKLYFNYGHFRNMLNPGNLFQIEEISTGAINTIGDPNQPMPKTVMYELGYEQNLFDMFHVRLAGYYRDLSNQPRNVYYESVDTEVKYNRTSPLNYGDVRGFEITLTKNRGKWLRGFVNYTYMATKNGNFGFSQLLENRVSMRRFMMTTYEHYQGKPRPEPFARMNLEFIVPEDFGPAVGGLQPLSDWRINLLGDFRQSPPTTWNGQSLSGGDNSNREIRDNTRWRDYWNFDLRFSKNFSTMGGDLQVFADITNVFNFRNMTQSAGFQGDRDNERYLRSLHWDKDIFKGSENGTLHPFIPGNDRPGDYRKEGVEFQPIEIIATTTGTDYNQRALYFHQPDKDVPAEGTWLQWDGDSFVPADQGLVKKTMDDKAYIDMPNESYFTFLNPRRVYFGVRLSF